MNKRKCLCLVLALCLVFGLVVPNNHIAQAATQTYDFNDMIYSTSYGTTYNVDEEGVLELTFESQYQEIRYSFPEPINMELCDSITVSAEAADSLAFKLYDNAGEEVFVEYGFSADKKTLHTIAPVLDGTVVEFGIMSLSETEGVTAKFYEIKVEMMSGETNSGTTTTKNTYNFNDMIYSTSYGTEYNVDEEGVLDLTFEGQYQEIRYAFPQAIDMTLCDSITLSAEAADSLAFKLYDDAGEEVFVEYGFSADKKTLHTIAPVLDGTVTELGIMSLAETADVTAKLYELSVVMKSGDSNSDANENKTTYTFNDMAYSTSYGTEYSVDESGALHLVFAEQYQEIRYSFPELLDMNLCTGIAATLASEHDLAVKLYDVTGEEVFVQYGVSAANKKAFTFAPVLDCKVAEFAVMLLTETTDAEAVIYDITVDMTPAEDSAITDTLLSTYGTLFDRIGSSVSVSQLQSNRVLTAITKEYNSITLENDMKPSVLLGSSATLISVEEAVELGYFIPENYTDTMVPKLNFSTIDTAMKICSENGLGMRGHTLIWHSQTPTWLFRNDYNASGDYVSTDVMDARMEFFVKSVINHVYDSEYGDCVYVWDVVNEYLHSMDKDSDWAVVYGETDNTPEFVKKAFLFAHEALLKQGVRDKVSLFYNDYNSFTIVDDIITMVEFINAETQLCDGIGMQAHLKTSYPSTSDFCTALEAFCNTGLEIQFTEFDVQNTSDTAQATYCYNLASGILDIYKAGGNITGLTIWGLYDGASWKSDQKPTLHSKLGTPKASYISMLQAYTDAGYTTEEEPTVTPEPTAPLSATVKNAYHWGNGGQVEIELSNAGETFTDGWTVELDLNISGELTNSWGDGFVTSFENGHVVIQNQDWVPGFESGTTKMVYLQYNGTLPNFVTCTQNDAALAARINYLNHWGNGGQIEILLDNTGATLTDGWGTELTINLLGTFDSTWGDGFVTSYENGHIVIKNQDWVQAFETGTTKSVFLQYNGTLPVVATNATVR